MFKDNSWDDSNSSFHENTGTEICHNCRIDMELAQEASEEEESPTRRALLYSLERQLRKARRELAKAQKQALDAEAKNVLLCQKLMELQNAKGGLQNAKDKVLCQQSMEQQNSRCGQQDKILQQQSMEQQNVKSGRKDTVLLHLQLVKRQNVKGGRQDKDETCSPSPPTPLKKKRKPRSSRLKMLLSDLSRTP